MRSSPRPQRVANGEPLVFARVFAAARSGARLLVVYVDNDGDRGALRSALFNVDAASPEAPALTRARDDVTLAPDARALSLAWDGHRGAVAFAVPRPLSSPLPPGQRRVRPPTVGVPPSTDDPMGPSASSGGSVHFLTLDESGAAASAARLVFSENARLWRVAVAREPDGWAVAWTGATVTDDEVRGTVRAMRLREDGEPTRAMASATGFSGEPGDGLSLTRVGASTVLGFTGSRCVAREGEPAPPPSLNEDPSASIDPPSRSPQPQGPVHRAPGPPIMCGASSLFTAELRADSTFGPLRFGPWIRSDATSIAAGDVIAPLVRAPQFPVFARLSLSAQGYSAPVDLASGASFALGDVPPVSPASIENLTRPAPEAELPARVHAIPPPTIPPEEPVTEALAMPRAIASSPAGRVLVAVTSDRHTLALVRPGAQSASVLATSPSLFHELSLPDPGDGPVIALSREGVWSGPVRWYVIPPTGAPAPLALRFDRAVPLPSLHTPRYPTTAPLRYDEEFSRLFAQTRLLRAQFMRHENLAGMMAARPEAPTDPRMPGLLAVRLRLRNRWESSCSALRARASMLARHGAGDDVLQGVSQVCEIHADLQLGVPVNPAL